MVTPTANEWLLAGAFDKQGWYGQIYLNGDLIPDNQVQLYKITRKEGEDTLAEIHLVPQKGTQLTNQISAQKVQIYGLVKGGSLTLMYTGQIVSTNLDVILNRTVIHCSEMRQQLINSDVALSQQLSCGHRR